MIPSFMCVVVLGQIWMTLHIEANFTFTPLQITAKSKPSLEPPPIAPTPTQEPSKDATPLQEISKRTTPLHETPRGTSHIQGPLRMATTSLQENPIETPLKETSIRTPSLQGPSPMATTPLQETPMGTPLQETSKGTDLQETPMGTTQQGTLLRTPPLQGPSPMGTTVLQETSTITTPLPESATGTPSQEQRRSTNNLATHYSLNTISSRPFIFNVNGLDKENVKNKALPTMRLQRDTSDGTNSAMAHIFAYLVGGILAIMVVTIAVIVIWKCGATRAHVDTIWAGRSPLTDAEFSSEGPITSDGLVHSNKSSSIASINSLTLVCNKKQSLDEDDNGAANDTKTNLNNLHINAQNEVNLFAVTTGMHN